MQDQQSSKKARLEAHDRQLSDHEEILKNLNSAHESLKSRIEEVEQKVNSQESKKTGNCCSFSLKPLWNRLMYTRGKCVERGVSACLIDVNCT